MDKRIPHDPMFLAQMGYQPRREPIRGSTRMIRNMPCPCGSGNKTKLCCGMTSGQKARKKAQRHRDAGTYIIE